MTITKVQKQLRCPSRDAEIKKMWYIFTMEYYSATKEGIPAFCGNMDRLLTALCKAKCQTHKDKYCTLTLLCRIQKSKTKEKMKKK